MKRTVFVLAVVAALLGLIIVGPAHAQVEIVPRGGGGGEASSITPGTTLVGSATNCFAYADPSSFLQCSSAFLGVDNSGAGNGAATFRKTPTVAQSFLEITGTLPSGAGGELDGVRIIITGSGSAAGVRAALTSYISAGYTGNYVTWGVGGSNATVGTGAVADLYADGFDTGLFGASVATSTNARVGVYGRAALGNVSIGGAFRAATAKASAQNIGVHGDSFNSSDKYIGGYFTLDGGSSFTSPNVSAGIVVDNKSRAVPIAIFRDNGTTVTQIVDGGAISTTQIINFANTNNVGLALDAGVAPAIIFKLAAMTPDAPGLTTDGVSNAWHILENADAGADLGNGECFAAVCTDPGLIVHSHNQVKTEYTHIKNDGTRGYVSAGSAIAGTDTNTAGQTLLLRSGNGTGTGNIATAARVQIQTPTQVASGTGAQTMTTRMDIGGDIINVQTAMTTNSLLTAGQNLAMPNATSIQFGGAPTGIGSIGSGFATAPNHIALYTGSTANAYMLAEIGDSGFDFDVGLAGNAANTEPAFIIHGATQNKTEFLHLNFYGMHGGNVTTLTDNTATAFFHTPTLSANGHRYSGTGTYAVRVTDAGGEYQEAVGTFEFRADRANTGGTTCSIQNTGHDGTLPGLPLKFTSSGTLAITLDCNVATNVASFRMTADTSLTATTFDIQSQFSCRQCNAELIPD